QHATATRSSKTDLRREGQPGALLYSLARVYAATSAVFRRDADLPRADRDRLAERYAARAVQLLESARGDDYFDSADTRRKLGQDRELDPLRKRADFKRLLGRVGPS